MGVFGIADFKFLGLETRFERNRKNRFWIFKITFLASKLKIEIEIKSLSISGKDGLDDPKLICEVIALLDGCSAAVEPGAWNKLMAAQIRQKDIPACSQTLDAGTIIL